MQQSIYDPILSTLRTTEDADKLMSFIDSLINSIYHIGSKNILEELTTQLPYTTANAITQTLMTQGIVLSHTEEMKQFLSGLKDSLKTVQLVILTLAFLPSSKLIESLVSHVQTLFGKRVILEINVDESLIGGAVIIYKGIYKDFSVKKRLDQFISHLRYLGDLGNL